MPLGKWPRHYAAQLVSAWTVAEQEQALELVPEEMRPLTRKHVEIHADLEGYHIATRICCLPDRTARAQAIEEAPEWMRERVKHWVTRLFKSMDAERKRARSRARQMHTRERPAAPARKRRVFA